MTLRDTLLPIADLGNKLSAQFGLSRYAVSVRTRTWKGDIGDAVAGYTDVLLVMVPPPDVTVMSPFSQQLAGIMMAGGTVEDRYFKIDSLTPQYKDALGNVLGGFTPAQLDPPALDVKTEINYLLTGDDGITIECNVVLRDFTDPFGYQIIVREKRRRTEQNAP